MGAHRCRRRKGPRAGGARHTSSSTGLQVPACAIFRNDLIFDDAGLVVSNRYWAGWVAQLAQFVKDGFEAFVECGILAHGLTDRHTKLLANCLAQSQALHHLSNMPGPYADILERNSFF